MRRREVVQRFAASPGVGGGEPGRRPNLSCPRLEVKMSRTAIRCNCGQRISQKEVMQTGYYPRPFGPSLVFVRFRCSRCKKLGEQYVKQEEWENGILKDATVEANDKEKERFAALGPIEMNE